MVARKALTWAYPAGKSYIMCETFLLSATINMNLSQVIFSDILTISAGMHALRSCGKQKPLLSMDSLSYGLQQVQPSAMREVALEVPQVMAEHLSCTVRLYQLDI